MYALLEVRAFQVMVVSLRGRVRQRVRLTCEGASFLGLPLLCHELRELSAPRDLVARRR